MPRPGGDREAPSARPDAWGGDRVEAAVLVDLVNAELARDVRHGLAW
ncbi:hypothetical protein ACIBSV_42180 [Embleya sp. NPDC050154]